MSLLRAVFQTGFTHHGSHLVADLLLFGTANQAPTLPLLWNCHRPYAPPNPLLQPRPLVYPPVHQASSGGYPPATPQGILQKTPFFFFLYALETTKIRHTLRNLLRFWGPCLYHLPPQPKPLHPPRPPSQPFPDPFPGLAPLWNSQPSLNPPPSLELPSPLRPPQPSPATKALGLPPRPPGQLRWVPPPTAPKKAIFLLFVRVKNDKNTTYVAKFAPSLGPVSLPPTPPNRSPCTPPQALAPPPLTPVHQASSGGYPPSLSPPSQPFPAHPTGHPSKKAIFLLFVRVRNDKNTTHVAKFAPSLGPVPLPPTPPRNRSPCTPSDRQANPSLTPSLDLLLFGTANQASTLPLLWNCHRPYAPPPNPLLQPRPLVYPPVHQASSGGYPPPPHRASFKKCHLSSFCTR